jgi:adenine deaminase
MNLKRIIDVAMGREKADLVLKGASVLNVFTEQLEHKDVAICDGMIAGLGLYDGVEEVDVSGKIIVPGFMDAHMHLESTLLTPAQFERGSLPCGTTAVMADPHEIANVAGTEGLDYIMRLCDDLDMHIYFNLPSCVPAAPLEESGETLEAEDLKPYYQRENVLGLAEMMNSVGVCEGEEALLKKLSDAKEFGGIIDGHAPFLGGKDLNAYVASGVRSDHECTDTQEALDKLARGQWIMVREGTAAKNLNALLPLCKPPYCNRAMLCTDDRHPEDLLREGHLDAIIRKAVNKGVKPAHAIQMYTINTATYFGLKDYGAVAPGYHADIVVLSDFIDFTVEQVYIDGKAVAKNGAVINNNVKSLPDSDKVLSSFHMQAVNADKLYLPIKERQRVIGLKKHELLTDEIIIQPTDIAIRNNGIDIDRDILKAAVFERHHNTGHIGIGFVSGYGIKRGAIATSVAHDSHNLIAVGCSDEDIATAAEAVRKMDGGMVVVDHGQIIESLPLPIAGLMSDLTIEEVESRVNRLKEAATALGASADIDPFMTLSFVSLPVIPVIRLNGKGMINVNRQEIVEATF